MTRKEFLGAYNIGHRDGKAGDYFPNDYDDIFDIEQETCEDCISRADTLKPYETLNDYDVISVWLVKKNIEQQKSVNSQETNICEERMKGECPYYAGY